MLSRADVLALPLSHPAQQSQGGAHQALQTSKHELGTQCRTISLLLEAMRVCNEGIVVTEASGGMYVSLSAARRACCTLMAT